MAVLARTLEPPLFVLQKAHSKLTIPDGYQQLAYIAVLPRHNF